MLSTRKGKQCLQLIERINHHGIEMFPCTRCTRSNLHCIVSSKDSTCCKKCVSCHKECDVTDLSLVSYLKQEEADIQKQKEETLSKLVKLELKEQNIIQRRANAEMQEQESRNQEPKN